MASLLKPLWRTGLASGLDYTHQRCVALADGQDPLEQAASANGEVLPSRVYAAIQSAWFDFCPAFFGCRHFALYQCGSSAERRGFGAEHYESGHARRQQPRELG